jgi:hypothetical protein
VKEDQQLIDLLRGATENASIPGRMKQEKMNVKNQKESDLEFEVQRLRELEAQEREFLERRYTEEDLIIAWWHGYDARMKDEQREGF